METRTGYKLFRLRKDGTLGPLFINRTQRLHLGIEYEAEDHLTKGYAHCSGWHISSTPDAPHLSKKNRVWARVTFKQYRAHLRPQSQGGLWYTAWFMTIEEIIK